MASSGSGYDLSSSTFSPDGRIFQVEYATKAVENAATCIGIQCSDGVVLAVATPLLHKMVIASCSYKRIHSVDSHAGIASTGFLPDARVLVTRAVEECADYLETYGSRISPSTLSDRLGAYAHYFTLHGALRPFGAACVLAGYDEDTKSTNLHLVEPSGVSYRYYGVAVGKGKQAAKTELEKLSLNKTPCTVAEAVKHCAKILTLLHQESDNDTKQLQIEMSWICEASGFKHVGVPKDIIKEATEWAHAQIEAGDDDEEDEAMEEAG